MTALPELDENMRAAAAQIEGMKSLFACDKSGILVLAINPEQKTLHYTLPVAKGDPQDLDTLARFLTRAFPASLKITSNSDIKQLTVVASNKEIFDQLAAPVQ